MATFKTADGLTLNLPDEGTTFRASGDNTNSTLYTIKNGQLSNIGSQVGIANVDMRSNATGQVVHKGDVIPDNFGANTILDNSFRGANISYTSAGSNYDTKNGAGSYSSLPQFNVADIQTAMSKLGSLPLGQSYSATVDPTNPNAENVQNAGGQTVSPANAAPQPGAITPGATPASNANPNVVNPQTGQPQPPVGSNIQSNPQTNQTVQPPTVNLQPGNTGPAVQQLQDYLVSQGVLQQSDLTNGGYGIYGPKTAAAVAALQQKLGVDNSSGVGVFGPKTQAAISQSSTQSSNTNASGITTGGTSNGATTSSTTDTSSNDPYAGLDPISRQVKMYTDAASALGLPTIKQQYQATLDKEKELTDKMNAAIADVNANPWYSEGVRVKEIQKVQDKYKTDLDTQSNLATLYDSLYKQGQAQVENIVSGAQADVKAANDLAQKQLDAATSLAKDNQVVSIGGNEVLINKSTGKQVAVLGPTPKAASTSGSTGTAAERAAAELQQYAKAFVPGATTSDGTPVIDNNGFVNPTVWKSAIGSYSGTRANFIKEFGHLLFSDANGISSKYGLTPTEQKLVTGAL